MMSACDDNVDSKQCYKCEQQLVDNLNIEFNPSNSMIVLWNKYQIFIYENLDFKSEAKVLSPEYQIQTLLITNNHILCVDINGFVHITTLKFKNLDQKLIRCVYNPRDQGIQACVNYSQDESLSLKYDAGTYFLCLNKINLDFTEVKKVALCYKDPWPSEDRSRDKYLSHQKIIDGNHELYKKLFNIDKVSSTWHFVVISFDKLTIYACLFDPKVVKEEINLIKLYSCPSDIHSFEMFGSENIVLNIGLKMGTVVRLTLNYDLSTTEISTTEKIVHLNSALHKLHIINETDTFLYTDGVTMWHSDKIFRKEIKHKQFFIRNVKDFILCENRIICTTFTKLIYIFPIQDEESYIKEVEKHYIPTETLLENSDYLEKIFEDIDKSKEIIKRLTIEGSYIAAIALANRNVLMPRIISSSVTVCNSLEEVMKENREELTLTEDISQYIQPDIYLLHITVKVNSDPQRNLLEIVSEILTYCDTELRITLSNEHKIIKTMSAKASDMNFLIPLDLENSTEINVNVSLMARVPGTFHIKQKIWTVIYKQSIKLTSDHFIRSNIQKPLIHFKGKDDTEKFIQSISNHFKDEFEFKDLSKNPPLHVMYVRLPENYKISIFAKHFINTNSQFMVEILNSDEFLKSQSEARFMIGKEAVALTLENDGFSNPRLKVASGNLQITANIRNFFADIVYAGNACRSGEQFINNSFYATVENLQKAVKNCITTSASFEEFAPLMEQFEKDVIGMLPV